MATKIQKVVRGHRARKKTLAAKEAVVKIQKVVRGLQTRRASKDLLSGKIKKELSNAAHAPEGHPPTKPSEAAVDS